jgi:CheY-like chemotaxis protein
MLNRFPKSRILIVDDDKNLLLGIKRSLIHQGYIVEIAIDGEYALEKIDIFKPHVIILDLKMPYMTGTTFLKMIKQFNPHIEVIILTGSSDFGSYTECQDHGSFSWLSKPVSIKNLIVKLNSAMAYITLKKDDDSTTSNEGCMN